MSGILWIVLIGFIAGVIARVLVPDPNNLGAGRLEIRLGRIDAE